jgi:tetratricopeptide (TPR) repeat protein
MPRLCIPWPDALRVSKLLLPKFAYAAIASLFLITTNCPAETVLQAGVFSDNANAKALADTLSAEGYSAETLSTEAGTAVIVRPRDASVEETQQALQNKKVPTVVRNVLTKDDLQARARRATIIVSRQALLEAPELAPSDRTRLATFMQTRDADPHSSAATVLLTRMLHVAMHETSGAITHAGQQRNALLRDYAAKYAESRTADDPALPELQSKLGHLIHYRLQDPQLALEWYIKAVEGAETRKDYWVSSWSRMQAAACLVEIARRNKAVNDLLVNQLRQAFEISSRESELLASENHATARRTRWTTARIGLMLGETLREMTEYAGAIATFQSIVDTYSGYPECEDEVISAMVLRTDALIIQNKDRQKARASLAESMKHMGRMKKSPWRGPGNDPRAVIHQQRLHIAKQDNAPKQVQEAILNEARAQFPDNPRIQRMRIVQ